MMGEFERRFPSQRKGIFLVYDGLIREEDGKNYANYSSLPEGMDSVLIKIGSSVVKRRSLEETLKSSQLLKMQIRMVKDLGYDCFVIISGAKAFSDGSSLEEGQKKLMQVSRQDAQYEIEEMLFDTTKIGGVDYSRGFVSDMISAANTGKVPYANSTPDSFREHPVDNSTAVGYFGEALIRLGKRPLFVVLTTFPGIYAKGSYKRQGQGTYVIRVVLNPNGIEEHLDKEMSGRGIGGMQATVNSAIQLQQLDAETIVTNGFTYQKGKLVETHFPIEAILQKRYVGTRFMPKGNWQ